MILILKATFGLGMMPSQAVETCCSHTGELVEVGVDLPLSSDESEDKNCCDGPACHCFCCHAVFLGEDMSEWRTFNAPLRHHIPERYYDLYQFLALSSIWQPPRV